MKTYYKPGVWNSLCDRCGFQYKSDELRSEWTGLMVCAPCYETRHPQDLLRVPREQISVPWSRPSPPDVFGGVGAVLYDENNELLLAENLATLLTET